MHRRASGLWQAADGVQLGGRFLIVRGSQQCLLCDQPVLSRDFYGFACNHCYHADCLFAEVRASCMWSLHPHHNAITPLTLH